MERISHLHDLHQPLLQMYENTHWSVVITDAKGYTLWINEASTTLTGFTPHDFAGKKPGSLLQGRSTDKETVQRIRQHIAEKKPFLGDILNYNKRGQEYWVELDITPIFDDNQNVQYFVSIQRDITNKRVLESLLTFQMKELQESLEYGKRIQTAVLPDPADVPEGIREWIVIYQPKDTLSGDFYWVQTLNKQVFLAVADGTGHGAPGALMATMGISLLNQALLNSPSFKTDSILHTLHNRLRATLSTKLDGSRLRDTIDMGLARINTLNGTVEYSGAKRPLVVAGPEGIRVYDGCKYSVGDESNEENPFSSTTILVNPEDTYYIYSDGIIDQFNDEGKKLSKQEFKKLIEQIHELPLTEQKKRIETFLACWQGGQQQLDDRVLVAFRV